MTIKITIDRDGEATTFVFDDAQINASRNVYRFYNYGQMAAADTESDGKVLISIVGINHKAHRQFQDMCAKYPIVQKV